MIFYMSIAWSYTERQVDIDEWYSGKQLLQETGDPHNFQNTDGVRQSSRVSYYLYYKNKYISTIKFWLISH